MSFPTPASDISLLWLGNGISFILINNFLIITKMATKKLNRKETNQEVQNTSSKSVEIKFIDVNLIIPNPLNPRKYFDADSLKELETSIANDGMLQAIKVRKKTLGMLKNSKLFSASGVSVRQKTSD